MQVMQKIFVCIFQYAEFIVWCEVSDCLPPATYVLESQIFWIAENLSSSQQEKNKSTW